jgi:glutathione S-transferase
MSLVLFGLQRSVYTRIARLALEEKAVPYELREVEIFGTGGVPSEHWARHPFGRIPVLEHDGFLLYETGAITRYVDERFEGVALQPADPARRARMNQAIGVLDSYAYRPMVWGVFVQRVRLPLQGKPSDELEIQKSLIAVGPTMKFLEDLLKSGPFLAGSTLSLADLHAFPMLRYLALAPEGRALLRGYASALRWFEMMQSRPSVLATISQYERE